jgi:hypothetical protein
MDFLISLTCSEVWPWYVTNFLEPIVSNHSKSMLQAVLGIRIRRIRMFSGLLDPDPLVRFTDPDTSL